MVNQQVKQETNDENVPTKRMHAERIINSLMIMHRADQYRNLSDEYRKALIEALTNKYLRFRPNLQHEIVNDPAAFRIFYLTVLS